MEYEHQLLRVPLECMQKICRSQQKAVEKDFLVVENAVKTLILREKDAPDVENTCNSIDKIVNKLCGVKRKLQDFEKEAQIPHEASKARMLHLHQCNPTNACVFGDPYNSVRVNRIIIDYLLRRGHTCTAEAIAQRHKMTALVDIDIFKSTQSVITSLEQHTCTEALAWCKEHQIKLKKLKSTFEIHLRLQEFIEMALAGKKMQAVTYARKYLSQHAESHMADIKFCMAMLCYDKDARCPKYKELMDGSRWRKLVEEFRKDLLAVYHFTAHPLLHTILQSGILALNTQQAYQNWSYNVNDPMCNKLFQQLAKKLPLTYLKNSSLVCRLSGAVMDGNNPPMVLPNGHVYSYQALQEMCQSLGHILCPATQQEFRWADIRKAFVM